MKIQILQKGQRIPAYHFDKIIDRSGNHSAHYDEAMRQPETAVKSL